MSDGVTICLIIIACLIYGKLCGIRNQLERIANVAEGANKRAAGQ